MDVGPRQGGPVVDRTYAIQGDSVVFFSLTLVRTQLSTPTGEDSLFGTWPTGRDGLQTATMNPIPRTFIFVFYKTDGF